jgi:hypothetical protein
MALVIQLSALPKKVQVICVYGMVSLEASKRACEWLLNGLSGTGYRYGFGNGGLSGAKTSQCQ